VLHIINDRLILVQQALYDSHLTILRPYLSIGRSVKQHGSLIACCHQFDLRRSVLQFEHSLSCDILALER
jgi:hypothetical protein